MKKRGGSKGDGEKAPSQYAKDNEVTERGQKFPKRFPKRFSERFKVMEGRAHKLLKILYFIEIGDFSRNSFAETESISLKTVQKDINFLKENGLVCYEGAPKSGKYKVTEKYKKLKKKL